MPNESDFIDDIVQDDLPKHTSPSRDKFLPWHRVKKEYIRRHQWNELIARMIEGYWHNQLQQGGSDWSLEEPLPTGTSFAPPSDQGLRDPLRCLIIPGEDILDIRSLWRDISHLKCNIRYLGFNEGQGSNQEGTRIHIANNSVISLAGVYKDSQVLRDRFEVVASGTSQGFRALKNYGPFHVVNLDLCGSICPNNSKDTTEYYNALKRLLTYQFSNQKTEWLLLITTMVEPSVVNSEKLKQLCRPTRDNVGKYQEFADKMNELSLGLVFQGGDDAFNLTALNAEQFVQLFGVALGKYLLELCQSASPKWSIGMRRSFSHSINEHRGATMLSLAFSLTPNYVPPRDVTGMTDLEIPPGRFPDEKECSIKLVKSVSNIKDVDELLRGDPELKKELRDAQADLLKAAGYDRDAYIKWVSEGEQIRRR